MKNKQLVFLYLLATTLLFTSLLFIFWVSGTAVLPTENRDFIGNARSIKPWVVYDRDSDRIIITNSRGVYGFDPSQTSQKNSYNFSLVGIGPYEMLRMLKHSYYSGHTNTHFFVGMDNVCGPIKSELNRSFYDADYLQAKPTIFFNLNRLKSMVLSPADMIRRLEKNKGYINDSGYQPDFPDSSYKQGGVYKSLLNRESKDYNNVGFSISCDTSAYREFLKFAYSKNIKVTLFTNPVHIRNYIAYSIQGKLDDYFWMIENLILYSEKAAKEFNQPAFPVILNNVVTLKTTEKFPTDSSAYDPMTWWYENSHFKSTLGNDVMIEMFKNASLNKVSLDGFAAFKETLSFDIKVYIQNEPLVVAQVKSMIKQN